MLYTRPQLRLLVALAATLLVGLGVREWRAGFPALADRLERFDREEALIAGAPGTAAARPGGRADAGWARIRSRGDGEARPGDLAADGPGGPVDLNRAGVAELARLPGVGPSLARRIVEERERSGAFDSPDSLRRVYGLGPRKLTALRGLVVADRPAEAVPPAAGGPEAGKGGEERAGEDESDGADDALTEPGPE